MFRSCPLTTRATAPSSWVQDAHSLRREGPTAVGNVRTVTRPADPCRRPRLSRTSRDGEEDCAARPEARGSTFGLCSSVGVSSAVRRYAVRHVLPFLLEETFQRAACCRGCTQSCWAFCFALSRRSGAEGAA